MHLYLLSSFIIMFLCIVDVYYRLCEQKRDNYDTLFLILFRLVSLVFKVLL